MRDGNLSRRLIGLRSNGGHITFGMVAILYPHLLEIVNDHKEDRHLSMNKKLFEPHHFRPHMRTNRRSLQMISKRDQDRDRINHERLVG